MCSLVTFMLGLLVFGVGVCTMIASTDSGMMFILGAYVLVCGMFVMLMGCCMLLDRRDRRDPTSSKGH